MKTATLTSDQTVARVIGKYHKTIHAWIALKPDYDGCHLARFCPLEYVTESYNMSNVIGSLGLS